jgi:Sulfatase-modifying factor enzyme 1
LTRTALALLLLLSAAASAQELDTALSALVRISGTRGDTPVRGSGFVIALDCDKATIVTASHVIERVQQIEVTFAADLARSFPAGAVLGIDAGNPRGLAAFQVRGAPAGVTSLRFDVESWPRLGEALFLLGFPQMELAPRTTQRALSGRREPLLLIDQGIGEGFSGGPVLLGGKVIAVVTETDEQTTYAVDAPAAHKALEGWGVKLECIPGEERTEDVIVFVRICPGTFTMGSAESTEDDEKPAHQVTLSEFWIGKTETTNKQYRSFHPTQQGDDDLPVANASWFDAQEACKHFGGRLPTEAEWEYAARAGAQTAWSFGDDETLLREHAWYSAGSDETLHPVGTKKPNAWGLYDMYGNVWEWVADWFSPYPADPQSNPNGPATGEARVLRGGAFNHPSTSLRSAFRGKGSTGTEVHGGVIGFRCARSPRRQS